MASSTLSMHRARSLHVLGYCASPDRALRERVKERGVELGRGLAAANGGAGREELWKHHPPVLL